MRTKLKLSPAVNTAIAQFVEKIQAIYDPPRNLSEHHMGIRVYEITNLLENTANKNASVALDAMEQFTERYEKRTMPTLSDVRDATSASWQRLKDAERAIQTVVSHGVPGQSRRENRDAHRDKQALERMAYVGGAKMVKDGVGPVAYSWFHGTGEYSANAGAFFERRTALIKALIFRTKHEEGTAMASAVNLYNEIEAALKKSNILKGEKS